MTEQPVEQPEPQGHPAWADLLNEIPEDLRPILEPKFQEFERNYQQKLQGTVEQYKPYENYKPLIEHNIPLEDVQKALWLAHELENNPQEVVAQAIEAFGLDFAQASQTANNNGNEEEEEIDFSSSDLSDLENHPAFKAIKEKAEQVEKLLQQREAEEEENTALNELQQELVRLHQDHDDEDGTPGFDDLYVTALMAQGVSPEDAVKSYNDTVNARAQKLAGVAAQQETPPVVMGGDGTSGSGVPKNDIRMGNLGKNDLNQMVLDLINSNE